MLTKRERSIDEIDITLCPYMLPVDLDTVKRYRDAGADEVIVVLFAPSADDIEPVMDAVAQALVEPAKAL